MKCVLLLAAATLTLDSATAVAQETEAPNPDSCIYDPDRPIFESTEGLTVELRSWSSDEALPFGWQTAAGFIGGRHMVTVSKIVCSHYFISAGLTSPTSELETDEALFKRLIAAVDLPEEPAPLTANQWYGLRDKGELFIRTGTARFSYFYTSNDAFTTYSFQHQFMVP
jgi:hypothetical protein